MLSEVEWLPLSLGSKTIALYSSNAISYETFIRILQSGSKVRFLGPGALSANPGFCSLLFH